MVSTLPGLATFASVAAAILYALGAALQLQSLRAQRVLALGTLATVTVPALALHGLATFLQMSTPDGLYLGFFTAGSLITLVMVLFVLVAAIRLPVQSLLVLVLPITIVLILAGRFARSDFTLQGSLSPSLVAHILVSISAYSILFMAACQSVMVAFQEHALKAKSSIRVLRLLPPLETMESLLFTMLWAGLIVLTLAIGTGFVFLEDMFAQHVVHHSVLSIASWVVYAVLLSGRHFLGWRSNTAIYWTLIAFSLLVLGYFGSKFVLEILIEP